MSKILVLKEGYLKEKSVPHIVLFIRLLLIIHRCIGILGVGVGGSGQQTGSNMWGQHYTHDQFPRHLLIFLFFYFYYKKTQLIY